MDGKKRDHVFDRITPYELMRNVFGVGGVDMERRFKLFRNTRLAYLAERFKDTPYYRDGMFLPPAAGVEVLRVLCPDEKIFRGMIEIGRPGQASAESAAMFNFWLHGKHMFCVDKDLAGMLLGTDIDIPVEAMRLPFSSLCLRYPPGVIDIFCDADGSYEPLDCVYVYSGKGASPVPGRQRRELVREDMDSLRSAMAYYAFASVRFSEAGVVPSNTDWCECVFPSEGRITSKWMEEKFEPVGDIGETISILKLAINTVLYINSGGAAKFWSDPPRPEPVSGKKSKRKAEKATRRNAMLTKFGYTKLLSPIVLPASARRAEPTKVGRLVVWARQWSVRGHWRWQAVGSGWSEHRLTWVRPYIKGPDIAERISRDYQVRKSEEKQ